jgi:PAS domain S-box-containing protein
MTKSILNVQTDVARALQMARASVEHTSDGIAWITQDARIVEANPAYCRFFGYSRDELLTLRIPDIDPGYNANAWQLHWEALRKAGTLTFQSQSITKSGLMIDIEIVATLVVFDGEEFNCAFLRDITPRKQAEQQLRLLETCVEHLNDIILITEAEPLDGDGPRIVFANSAFERRTGYSREEVIGQTPRILQGAKTSRVELDRVKAALIKWQPIRAELLNYTKSGEEFWIELDIVPIANADGWFTHWVAVERDISERKREEQRKIEFISTVSHELRTPLTAIRGALGLINGGIFGNVPDQAKSMINMAHDNSERLSHLINDLLNVQKMEAGMMEFDIAILPLAPLLQEAILSNLSFGASLGVNMVLTEPIPQRAIRVDAGRFQQVLANLLSNACKYSNKGGTVYLRAIQVGQCIRIEVQDEGNGIPAAFRERIFQKFAQADASDSRARGGTGLGLAIAKEMVQKMGGTIDYVSTEGQGSVFFTEWPLMD